MTQNNLRVVSDNAAPARAPRAPSTLGKVGKEEWRRIMPILAADGRLSEDKRSLVISYCEAVEGAHECAQILRKQGRIIEQRKAPPKAHPAVRQHLQYQGMALRLAERLGIVAGAENKDRKPKNDSTASVFD